MTDRPTLSELVAQIDECLRDLGWEQPYPEAPFIWRHHAYGVWGHDQAVGIAIRVTDQAPLSAPGLHLLADQAADLLEQERVYGSSQERLA